MNDSEILALVPTLEIKFKNERGVYVLYIKNDSLRQVPRSFQVA